MALIAYCFERLCFVTYAMYVFYTAMANPSNFVHLTFWTLILHTAYFSIDKASPHAQTAVYMLHGASFAGAISIFLGYAIICMGGISRFGSWHAWENALQKSIGSPEREFADLVTSKFFEHAWPPLAAIFDVFLSKDTLARIYCGAAPIRTTLLSVGSFLSFGIVWELTSKAAGTDPLQVYLQPEELGATALLKMVGMDNSTIGLPEDIFFTNFQKVVMVTLSITMYWLCVRPLFVGTPSDKSKKA